ncbi:hypothetical protein GCM10010218_05110 [Streptomyces mashuensis]|uniref:Uncharacterized protein n=1 Tax=Streptomyces mashuensis TaxID=33904 RepID=A0A919E9H1_9ACTN|nr:hypothetical protein [Streptomyces mashuensis]GHF27156.1 hypothetical protein GCM10010218_05110 [Streptomyces mashuensis]
MGTEKTSSRAALPPFEQAEPLGPQDAAFVRDLIEVLDRHGNLDRFGLCLLHDHFPVAADEILTETTDHEARTLHTRVEKKSRTRHNKPSQWRFLPDVHHSRRDEYAGDPYEVILVCDPYSGCPPRG